MTWPIRLFLAAGLALMGFAVFMAIATAHDAPSGWAYPSECCSNTDCAPMPVGSVKREDDGWHLPNGEVFAFGTERQSGDHAWHWCLIGGKVIIARGVPCLYAPPGGT